MKSFKEKSKVNSFPEHGRESLCTHTILIKTVIKNSLILKNTYSAHSKVLSYFNTDFTGIEQKI